MQTVRIGAGIRPFTIDQKAKADLMTQNPLGGIEFDLQAEVYLDMPSGLKNPSVISSGSTVEGLGEGVAPRPEPRRPHPGMEQSTRPQVGGAAANPRTGRRAQVRKGDARSLSHPGSPETTPPYCCEACPCAGRKAGPLGCRPQHGRHVEGSRGRTVPTSTRPRPHEKLGDIYSTARQAC
jgi:hypothetical protein